MIALRIARKFARVALLAIAHQRSFVDVQAAPDTDVLAVIAVRAAKLAPAAAMQQRGLGPGAIHVISSDKAGAAAGGPPREHHAAAEPKLAAGDLRVNRLKPIVTHGTPLTIHVQLEPAGQHAVGDPNFVRRAVVRRAGHRCGALAVTALAREPNRDHVVIRIDRVLAAATGADLTPTTLAVVPRILKRAAAALRPLYLVVALTISGCCFIQRYKDDLALGHNQSIVVSAARVHVPANHA